MIDAARAAVENARAGTQGAIDIRGVGVAATASTPIPVMQDARALAANPAFAADIDAQAWLWRDHSAGAEAEEITDMLKRVGAPALAACGGSYSAEWYWSKILRCARIAPRVLATAAGWLELCDFATAWLIGARTLDAAPRSVCAAGHKALHVDAAEGGWGAVHALASLHPDIGRLGASLPAPSALGARAGVLAADIADAIGLSRDAVVSVGVIDAHAAALGAGVRPGRLVSIVGTSACHMGVGAPGVSVPRLAGVSGVVRGSILPACDGVEAGQAAVGDMFSAAARLVGGGALTALEDEARRLPPGAGGLIALDWVNGVRAPTNDPFVSGAVFGLTLQTRPAQLFRAYVEAAAYGLQAIIDHMACSGLVFTEVVACGGVMARSALAPQVFADVLDRDLDVLESVEAGALGAAILGAAASGLHGSVAAAQSAMAARPDRRLRPDRAASAAYRDLYLDYACLAEACGRPGAPLNSLMRRLAGRRAASPASVP